MRVADSFGNKHGSSGFWSDKVCHLCLEFEVMSHGGTERTEDYKAIVVTEAPSVHRATELVCQFYWQFIYKTFIPKYLARICTLHLRHSLCPRHLRDIALPPSPP